MTDDLDRELREVTASMLAHDLIIRSALQIAVAYLGTERAKVLADELRHAIRHNNDFSQLHLSDFRAEFLSDVSVLAAKRLDALLAQVLGAPDTPDRS